MNYSKVFYVGNGIFDMAFGPENSNGVKKIILMAKHSAAPVSKITFENNLFSFNIKIDIRKFSQFSYDTNMVLFNDDKMEALPYFSWYFNDYISTHSENLKTDIIKFHNRIKSEVTGKVQSKIDEISLDTVIHNFETTYSVNPSDLENYRGVIMNNGEEFISENPQELANFINSRKYEFTFEKIQETILERHFCWSDSDYNDCLIVSEKPLKNHFKLKDELIDKIYPISQQKYKAQNELTDKIMLIQKGDVTQFSIIYNFFSKTVE